VILHKPKNTAQHLSFPFFAYQRREESRIAVKNESVQHLASCCMQWSACTNAKDVESFMTATEKRAVSPLGVATVMLVLRRQQ
jgi:hypothetical protein